MALPVTQSIKTNSYRDKKSSWTQLLEIPDHSDEFDCYILTLEVVNVRCTQEFHRNPARPNMKDVSRDKIFFHPVTYIWQTLLHN